MPAAFANSRGIFCIVYRGQDNGADISRNGIFYHFVLGFVVLLVIRSLESDIDIELGRGDGKDIVITVSDNGLGMTKEQCETILKKDRSDSKGIGVKNVNDRLKIYFGDEYGISIESELDVGTTVKIKIPKIEKGRENEY